MEGEMAEKQNLITRPALLVLLRHAESERNKIKKGNVYFADDEARELIRGIPDYKIPITSDGWKQSRLTGMGLRKRFGCFDYVYHSGYKRTIETTNGVLSAYTAEEIARIKVRQNMFIKERQPGYAYDMTKEEAERHFPWLQEYWKTFGGFFAEPPGGESLAKMSTDVYLFLNMLFRDRAGQKVLAVTHGGTLRCFRFLLEHWNYDQAAKWPPNQSPKNCGVTIYEFSPGEQRLVLKEYNTTFWAPEDLLGGDN
jgi:2,3-bisphosphoglycerate-dependent phosphoglycerate mutase